VRGAARLVWMMVRPPVAVILLLFAALGMAAAGRPDSLDPVLGAVVVVVAGWFVHATVLNDRADEAIDRVNLPNAPGRPLVAGLATRGQLLVLGNGAGVVALAVGLALDWRVAAVVAAGLVLSWAYSMPPLRISSRGAVASLLLPLGYVALPFLVGWLAVRPAGLDRTGLALLGGLYVTFVGRIVLKDFRDVRGDALYGKRTFLLRHGARATCRFSAACWIVGSASILLLAPWQSLLTLVLALYLGGALVALSRLAAAPALSTAERAAIAAVAVVGRAMAITLLAHYSMVNEGWPAGRSALVLGVLAAVFSAKYAATLAVRHREPALRPS
jgi:4-hydroxybenzoate polyprenyltransferase